MRPGDRAALAALLDLGGALLAARTPAQVEAVLTERAAGALRARSALFLRPDREGDTLRVTAGAGVHVPELGLTLARGEGPLWRAARGPDPVLRGRGEPCRRRRG